jgi:hypothetical protein
MKCLLVTSKEIGLDLNADKSKSCLEIRKEDEVTIKKMVIDPLKGENCSNSWEQK